MNYEFLHDPEHVEPRLKKGDLLFAQALLECLYPDRRSGRFLGPKKFEMMM